ncbi:MAG: hypothetical protein R3Y36_02045 [Spirochaetales bacterium]
MAIQPIDLQVMYTQLEKVSKMVSHREQGVQLQGAIQQAEQARQAQEKHKTVEQAKMDEDGLPLVKDRNGSGADNPGDHTESDASKDENGDSPSNIEVIRDPFLGQRIDISG